MALPEAENALHSQRRSSRIKTACFSIFFTLTALMIKKRKDLVKDKQL